MDEGDGLLQRIERLQAFVVEVQELDELDAMERLSDDTARPSTKVSRTGNKNKWRCTIDDVRAKVVALGASIDQARQPVLEACAHRLGAAMRHHTIEAAHRRRAAGELEFHDLLVLARKVLADPVQGPEVRASLHQRYQRLLLDEFQDTDPIQIELAVRIAAADPAHADEPGWADVQVRPGHLFVVGDPKQSIYRFRRADIGTFLQAQHRFAAGGRDLVELTANFRTVEPVISWINDTFDALMSEPPERDVPVPSQPRFVALDAERADPPSGPPMAVLGTEAHPPGSRADVLRTAEAADVAHAVTVALRERWAVRDGDGWRDARLGDVTILVPARTSLPFLEQALEGAGIPFRTESSSLVYASRAVRDLMMVLRAADDPTDHLRIVGALRTPCWPAGTTTSSGSRSWRTGAGTTPSRSSRSLRRARWSPASPCSAPCTGPATGPPPPSSCPGSPRRDGPWSWASPRAGRATCGGASASWWTRPGPGARPPGAACAPTSTGWTSRRSRGRG